MCYNKKYQGGYDGNKEKSSRMEISYDQNVIYNTPKRRKKKKLFSGEKETEIIPKNYSNNPY